MIENEVLS